MENNLAQNDIFVLNSDLQLVLERYKCMVTRSLQPLENQSLMVIPDYDLDFKRYCKMVLQSADADHTSMSRWALEHLELSVDDGFWLDANVDDIIEFYMADMRRLYVSPNFFLVSGYTMEDLFKYPWHEIYERDNFIDKRLQDIAMEFISGRIDKCIDIDIPEHVVSERFSEEKTVFSVKIKKVAPIKFKNNQLAGFATINSVKVINN